MRIWDRPSRLFFSPARLADKRVLRPDPLANHPGPEGEGGAPPSPPASSSTPSGPTSLLVGKRCPMRAKLLPFRITGPHQVRGSGSNEARSTPYHIACPCPTFRLRRGWECSGKGSDPDIFFRLRGCACEARKAVTLFLSPMKNKPFIPTGYRHNKITIAVLQMLGNWRFPLA